MINKILESQYPEFHYSLEACFRIIDEVAILSITDLTGKIIFVNEKFTDASRYSAEELIGHSHNIVRSDEHSADFFSALWQTISSGKHWHGEIKNRTKDGNYYWTEIVIIPVTNKANQLYQYVSISHLITAQKEQQQKIWLEQQELKNSAIFYKDLFNNSPFPTSIADKKTLQILEVNETATKLYGYSREEFLQLNAFDIRVPEEHSLMKAEIENGNYPMSKNIRTHRKKNGETLKTEPFITEIVYLGKEAFFIIINDVTEKIKMQEELIRTKMLQQNDISRVSMEAHEKHRAEIGRELHDNVNQLLVASNLYLKNIRADLPEKELIEKSILINTTAINEIRKLSWSLVPPSLNDLSLKDTIEESSNIFELIKASVSLNIDIEESNIKEGLKINIYRIVQEHFNNIIKHSGATIVTLDLVQEKNTVKLNITDNGNGYDQKIKSNGIGITNILHRVETYNGNVKMESSPGKGCRLYVEFIL